MVLVLASAIVWSFGGALKHFITTGESWTIVFWRSVWAALFLLAFMLVRKGGRNTLKLFADMGLPGICVGICFATASTCFIVALNHTTVANILLMQAGVPLIAALIIWILFRERVTLPTWIAIAFVIMGVAVMVSDSFSGKVSPMGDALSLLIAFAFACATVITRRYAHVRMVPAVCLGTVMSACVSAVMATTFIVTLPDMGILIVFGSLNLGVGLALFVTGVRLVPSALAALLGTTETVLGPIWMWLIHDEIPTTRTMTGGLIVLTALICHISWRIYSEKSAIVNKTPI
ncbi:MAG: DMT family transporter [Desulfobacula sp.]|nr:DMT family transporter [Desulfobacula sp.]MBT3486258.1 DMT family transporter [Desulfobacula sp.]MBT3805730.1 DMT family transporter [Desulfobacula sp.]MBT4025400.1 DMT family transporter [Desulfobacula sp.]MBT4200062.1 DMT family transporter [Desulfobacula sp.]